MTLEEAKKIRFCNGRGYSTIEFIQALQLTEEIKNNNTMTQENKQLLLKDLCARLPYGVKVLADIDKTFDGGCIGIINKIEPYVGNKFPELKGQYLLYEKDCLTPLIVDEVRPYLRSMSSMTEDERKEYKCLNDALDENYEVHIDNAYPSFDWLNKHHFDYRGLIEKGLALEAKEGMYEG